MVHVDAPKAGGADAIRVAIIDDHPVARRGIAQVLQESPDITVVLTAGSLAELAARTADARPADSANRHGDTDARPGDEAERLRTPWPETDLSLDVVVMDLYLDGDSPSLSAVAELAGAARVLVMSASGRPADVLGAIQAGASGYLTKRASPELLTSAVETLAAGGFSLSADLADVMQAALLERSGAPATAGKPAPQLSPRETETLRLIASGLTHSQIATRIGVTKATVDTYVERIRAKLQVGNKADLTRAALARLDIGAP